MRRAVAVGRLPTCWDRVTNASASGGPNRSGARRASRRSRAAPPGGRVNAG
ncbi:hypothetical protein [Micromonospora palomenae]|uniref:hypothetical protein n=1 Tax=Micromonospora palomenae TaxID=1461247 RepID=UPI003F88ECF6